MKKHMAFQSLTYVLVMFSCFRSSWSFFFMSSISWQDQWRTMVMHFDQHPRGPKGVPRGFEGGPKGVPQGGSPLRGQIAPIPRTPWVGQRGLWSYPGSLPSRRGAPSPLHLDHLDFPGIDMSNSWIGTPVDTCCCGVCRKKKTIWSKESNHLSPDTVVL